MPQEDEVGLYLKSLIDHADECMAADCPDCRMLRTIYDLLRRQIFGTAPFPHLGHKPEGGKPKIEAHSSGS